MAKNPTVKMIDAHQLSCTCAAPFPTKQNPHKALARKPHTLSATVTQKMAWRSAGSLSRSLVSNARVSSLRSAPPLRRLRPPTVSTPRRLSFASPREERKRRVMRRLPIIQRQENGASLQGLEKTFGSA